MTNTAQPTCDPLERHRCAARRRQIAVTGTEIGTHSDINLVRCCWARYCAPQTSGRRTLHRPTARTPELEVPMTTTEGRRAVEPPPGWIADLAELLGDDLDDFVWQLAEGAVTFTVEVPR